AAPPRARARGAAAAQVRGGLGARSARGGACVARRGARVRPPSAFFVLFAVSMAASFTAARFVRRTGRGLLLVCLVLGGWAGALLLLEESAWGWAERLLPSGMLLAGAFLHAAADLSGWRRPRVVRATWAASAAVAAIGLAAPRLLYGPGARGAGP